MRGAANRWRPWRGFARRWIFLAIFQVVELSTASRRARVADDGSTRNCLISDLKASMSIETPWGIQSKSSTPAFRA
jgi:hypothetical protein